MSESDKREELTRQEVLVQEFLEKYRDALDGVNKIKTELGEDETPTQIDEMPLLEDKVVGLTSAMSSLRVTNLAKLKKFTKGDNFSTFCDRFMEYADSAKMKDANLYRFILQHVDDETYSTLRAVELTQNDKQDASRFCELYKKAYYGEEGIALKNELMSCTQKEGEDISTYSYRLREKANVAYLDSKVGEENCLLSFLRGVHDMDVKVKLNEATLTSFNDAVKLARKLEGVKTMFSTPSSSTSILKQTTFEERKDTGAAPGPRPDPVEEDRPRYRGSESRISFDRSDRSRSRSRDLTSERDSRRGRGSSRPKHENGPRRRDGRDLTCWNCNKVGHRQINCWSRDNRSSSTRRSDDYRPNRNSGYSDGNSYSPTPRGRSGHRGGFNRGFDRGSNRRYSDNNRSGGSYSGRYSPSNQFRNNQEN